MRTARASPASNITTRKKQKQVQEASVVVLAAWSAQNPRLLLNSATDKHPNGLANKNQLVGKFMMTHHIAGTWALFDEDITPHMGTVGAQFMSYDRYAEDELSGRLRQFVHRRRRGDEDERLCRRRRGDLFGAELQAFMKRAARGITRITIFGEDQPQLENRIELASDKDEFGMPLARLIHSFDDDAMALWNANFDQGMKVAKATDAKEVWPGKGPVMPTSHLHGGAIMGTGPENSVTNSYGQTHEIRQSVDGRALHLPERRRVEPDLHDLRRVAARRGEPGEEFRDSGGLAEKLLSRRFGVPEAAVERLQQILGCLGDYGAGREDRLGACRFQRLVILRRHDAADDDHDVAAALLWSSSALSSGTSVRCAAASDDTPRMCTSFSTACRAASAGVANSAPISTSKPRSAKAEAITFWPRSWPSWPILATRMRGRRPSFSSNSATSFCTRSTASVMPTSRL